MRGRAASPSESGCRPSRSVCCSPRGLSSTISSFVPWTVILLPRPCVRLNLIDSLLTTARVDSSAPAVLALASQTDKEYSSGALTLLCSVTVASTVMRIGPSVCLESGLVHNLRDVQELGPNPVSLSGQGSAPHPAGWICQRHWAQQARSPVTSSRRRPLGSCSCGPESFAGPAQQNARSPIAWRLRF